MTLKKRLIAVLAAGVLTASALPALALENEFHGMFKAFGYYTNTYNGYTVKGLLSNNATASNYFEQRARILYMAKASDDLKLVTQFELDTRFGGINTTTNPYKGTASGNDSGQLDADSITFETKWVYLDFNEPWAKTNFKVGMQGWKDAYQSLFLLADMTGLTVTKKFGDFTASIAGFRYYELGSSTMRAGHNSNSLLAFDGKYAFSKDATLGLSYYYTNNNNGNTTAPAANSMQMPGISASFKFDGSVIEPFFAYQFGNYNQSRNTEVSAYLAGVVAKAKLPSGAFNFNLIYLSGEDQTPATMSNGDVKAFQTLGNNYTYFNAANMWLLIRNKDAVNSSTSIFGNDMTVGGRGQLGIYAGYEGAVDKFFYAANVGYAQTAAQRTNSGAKENSSLGTEVNATIGYKLYDSLSVSLSGAYCFLGEGLKNTTAAGGISGFTGGGGADDPFMGNIQVSYAF
jgi:hypothetical protein